MMRVKIAIMEHMVHMYVRNLILMGIDHEIIQEVQPHSDSNAIHWYAWLTESQLAWFYDQKPQVTFVSDDSYELILDFQDSEQAMEFCLRFL
jgi:hypothetical protein